MKLIDESFEANPNVTVIIPNAPNYKPIKIVFLGDLEIINSENKYDIEIKKKMSEIEAEKFLNDVFGTTTDLGILSCGDAEEKLNE